MELWLLDKTYTAVKIIDGYKSFIWTDRYDSYGDFELYLPMQSELITEIKKDYYLYSSESEHIMIVENLIIETDAEEGDYLIVSGRSLESLLLRRIIFDVYTVEDIKFQTVIKKLITDAFITPASGHSARAIPNFIFEDVQDSYIDSILLTEQFYASDLYSIINSLCIYYSVGFKLILDEQNNLVFSLYSGEDRSYDQVDNPYVVFSPKFDNLIDSTYASSNTNLNNVAVIYGETDYYLNPMAFTGTVEGIDRRELMVDGTNISRIYEEQYLPEEKYIKLLVSAGEEELAQRKTLTSFEGTLDYAATYKYGEDFFMGDIVQFEDKYENVGKVRVIELIRSYDNTSVSVYPTFELIEEGA